MKRILATIVIIFILISTYAQRPSSKLGIALDFAHPQSNFGSNSNYGVGPSAFYLEALILKQQNQTPRIFEYYRIEIELG